MDIFKREMVIPVKVNWKSEILNSGFHKNVDYKKVDILSRNYPHYFLLQSSMVSFENPTFIKLQT